MSRRSAFDRLVFYLARRDHTVLELRQKLKRYHEEAEIAPAIEKAERLKLIPDSRLMSERLTESLLRRGKGPRYISGYLKKKGLPGSSIDPEAEIDRAKRIVLDQLRFEPPFSLEQKQKIFRYLSNRGFTSQTVRAITNASTF